MVRRMLAVSLPTMRHDGAPRTGRHPSPIHSMSSHSLFRGALRGALRAALPVALTALLPGQGYAQAVYKACFVPLSGTVYRVGVPNAPAQCLQPSHVAFQWTDGADAFAALQTALKTTDQAGGDVTGLFSNLTVGKLLGRALATTPPTDGQVLAWNATTNKWEPKTVAAGGGGGGVTDHGALTGLGDDDHPQYLLSNGVRNSPNGFVVKSMWGSAEPVVSGIATDGPALLWHGNKGALWFGAFNEGYPAASQIGQGSLRFGANAVAGGAGSLAGGNLSYASAMGSVALGSSAEATGNYSFAMGENSRTTASHAFAYGNSSAATGTYSLAFGDRASAKQNGAVAMGTTAIADGDNAFAFGNDARATGTGAVALSGSARASGFGAFAFRGIASGGYSMAFGDQAIASGTSAFALGGGANAGGLFSIAWGGNSIASGTGSVAIGSNQTKSTANYAYALGAYAVASKEQALAIGYGADATGVASIAIGHDAYNGATASGENSIALGDGANTNNFFGAMVVNTGTTVLNASAAQQFSARFTGGFRLFTSQNNSTGCSIAAGGGQWSCTSDSTTKTNITTLDGEQVLTKLRALPVSSWEYRTERGARHIGPMAQDFHAAFGLGNSDKSIAVLDASGVALAAAKALESRTVTHGAGIDALRQENASLRTEVARLTDRLAALEAAVAQIAPASTRR